MIIIKSTKMLSYEELEHIKNAAMQVIRKPESEILILPEFLKFVNSPSTTCAHCGITQPISGGGCSYCGAPLPVIIYGEFA